MAGSQTEITLQIRAAIKDEVTNQFRQMAESSKRSGEQMRSSFGGIGAALSSVTGIAKTAAGAIKQIGFGVAAGLGIGGGISAIIGGATSAITDYVKELNDASKAYDVLIARQGIFGINAAEITERLRAQAVSLRGEFGQKQDATAKAQGLAATLGIEDQSLIEQATRRATVLSNVYAVDLTAAMKAVVLASQGAKDGFKDLGAEMNRRIENAADVAKAFRSLDLRQLISRAEADLKGLAEQQRQTFGIGGAAIDSNAIAKKIADTTARLQELRKELQEQTFQKAETVADAARESAIRKADELARSLEGISRTRVDTSSVEGKLAHLRAATEEELAKIKTALHDAQDELTFGGVGIDSQIGARLTAAGEGAVFAIEKASADKAGAIGREAFFEQGNRNSEEFRAKTEAQNAARLSEIQREAAAFKEIEVAAMSAAANVESSFGDALATVATRTGTLKQAFKSLEQSVIASAARMAAKLLTVLIIKTLVGGGSAPKAQDESAFFEEAEGGTWGSGGTGHGFERGRVSRKRFEGAYRNAPMRRLAQGGTDTSGGSMISRESFFAAYRNAPLRRFDRGGTAGILTQPTLAVAGENGDEAFVPLQGGKIPVRVKGGGQNITIHYAPQISTLDGQDTSRVMNRSAHTILAIVRNGMITDHALRSSMQEAS